MMIHNLRNRAHLFAAFTGLCGCAGAVGDDSGQQNFAENLLDVETSGLGEGGEELGASASTASVGPDPSHQSVLDTEVDTESGVEAGTGGDEEAEHEAGEGPDDSDITETESDDGPSEADAETTTGSADAGSSEGDCGETSSGGEMETDTTTENEESGDDPICGDGVVNTPYELCDGGDLGGFSCQSEGFDLGIMACTPRCWIDPTNCRNHPQPDTGVYADCLTKSCVSETLCVEILDTEGAKVAGYCSKFCVDAPDCPGSPGGTARPVCVQGDSGAQMFCALNCAGGLTCPEGMSCTPLVGGAMHCI